MNYSAACRYLFSFLNYERIPFEYGHALNLKRMACVLNWAGHPERKYPSILVAGTKGKGSTANFIASILSAHGYRTGLYTSPHLIDPRERIRVHSKIISKNEFAESVAEASRIFKKHRGPKTPYGALTFFELFTFVAMLHFAKKNVEIAVFEVGMGGRLDATNVLNPLVSVMTPISFDHEEHLGRTLSKIAGEKAEIIKKKGTLVLSAQEPEAQKTILHDARKMRAKIFCFGDEFKVSNVKCSAEGSRFNFQMGKVRLNNLFIKLPGAFQVQNAACALAATVILSEAKNLCIDSSAFSLRMTSIRKGLQNAFWPGRFEVVKRSGRTYVLDGAHNGASAEALARSLKQVFPGRSILFIFGVSREKDLKAVFAPFIRITSSFIMTKSTNLRAQEPKTMVETLYDMGFSKTSFCSSNLKEALEIARNITGGRNVIVITGSLFLVGEARKRLKCQPSL